MRLLLQEAIRDASAPSKMLAAYDSCDHPNDQGYQAMANAIDLSPWWAISQADIRHVPRDWPMISA